MKGIVKALHRPSVACLVISLVVLGAVLGVRAQGWLQLAELTIYDHFVQSNSEPDSTDERIAIVGMTEDDLEKYGFPIDDERMAQVLTGLDAQEPAAIGLDMYRDLPEPRDRSKYPALEAAFKKLPRVIAIQRVGYVKPPPALADQPDRICANNLEKDFSVDGYYRRGPLAIERDVPEPLYSLSLALTLKYLELHEVDVELVEVVGRPEAPLFRLGKTVFPRLTSNAGGYVGLDVHDYEYLVDFRAPRRFRVQDARGQLARDTPYDFSFGDVIEGRLPPGALKGKIVFVGTVMQSIKDSNPTPIDDNLRGMHQHVMMTHQLLEAAIKGVKPRTWWPEWAEVAWIAVATLLGGALGLMFRSPWKLAPALALLLAGIGFGGALMFQHGTWMLVAAPGLGGFISATLVTSFIAYLEKSERGEMHSLFSKHVSPKVVEALWAGREQFLDGGRLKPQRLTATVLFTDLKGFSTTSEKMDPTTLMEWMNEYMNGVARHVDLNHGIINKFIGDAIMAVFGVPIARTREEEMDADAVNAVTCALAMRTAIAALNETWRARDLPTTAMRIGIYTGALVAGSFGSEDRLEFTVLGDTVNTAARLEAAGKDAAADPRTAECTILIGDSTAQRLRGRFETQLLGPISLKGKADKIVVHSVIGTAQDAAVPAA
ncbi:MAG: adenylate/guanylate cyclase domain-containing protein [Chthoniobacteraceae bacterium]